MINVSTSRDGKTDLPYATVNGDLVARALGSNGYIQLLKPLHGSRATGSNIREALKNVANQMAPFQTNGLLLIYYSGHGTPAGKQNLRLATYDEAPSPLNGLDAANLLEIIREDKDKHRRYAGPLILIIDACFSGTMASLNLDWRFAANTVVLTSSNQKESFNIKRDGTELSAFTSVLVDVLQKKKHWRAAEDDHNGMLIANEFKNYAIKKLKEYYDNKKIHGAMQPKAIGNGHDLVLSYDASACKNCNVACQVQLTQLDLKLSLREPEGRIALSRSAPFFFHSKRAVEQRREQVRYVELVRGNSLLLSVPVERDPDGRLRDVQLSGPMRIPPEASKDLKVRLVTATGKSLAEKPLRTNRTNLLLKNISADLQVEIEGPVFAGVGNP